MVRVEPGSQVSCSATGTPPIYIALIRNFTVLMNTTNTASSKLYQEGNYTCVATSKYGTDAKHFLIKGGERIRYFETNSIKYHNRQYHNRRREGFEEDRISPHGFFIFLIVLICFYEYATNGWKPCEVFYSY